MHFRTLQRTGPVRTLLPLLCTVTVLGAAEEEPPPADDDRSAHARDLWSRDLGGGAQLRLIDLSAVLNVAAGGSSADDHEYEAFVTGAHDPNRDGFTFQALELSLAGAVDPYFRAAAYLNITPDHGVELEEAYAVSTALPHGMEVEAGYMLTEFGRYNPTHAHEWFFINQPLAIGALLGPEGMRGVGVRAAWLLPTSWFAELHLGAQNADDDSMVSFLGEGHHHGEGEEEEGHQSRKLDGIDDLLWLARLDQSWDFGEDVTSKLGLSLAYGPNAEDDHTALYGVDLVTKWYRPGAPAGSGTLTTLLEAVVRDAGGGEEEDTTAWGFVAEAIYGFRPRWEAGLRGEYIDIEHHEEGGAEEELELEEAWRASPLLRWSPSEFTRFRLQYDYTAPEEGDAIHSAWLGLEVLIGTHPAHKF